MKNIILITISLLFAFVSCKKEKFPDMNELKGSWIELTDNSFKHKLIFEDENIYFVKPSVIDTFSFRLNKEHGTIHLSLKNHPSSGESNHEIVFNKKENTITLWGLFGGTPNYISKTTFKRE